MLVGLSCMQLVEQGKLSLDDHEQLYSLCPELRDTKVLVGNDKLVEREKGREITLRSLLTHTSGFGYEFFNKRLLEYGRRHGPTASAGFDVFSGDIRNVTSQPLANQPGEVWEYSIGIDWAGIVVERATRLSLHEYMTKNIFEPLGLKNIGFFLNDEMRKNIMGMTQRYPDGHVEERDHLYRAALLAETEEQRKTIFNSGGAGCFAKPSEYCQILATLLNDGVSPTTGNRILKKETVDAIWENQIPQFPNFARQGLVPSRLDYANPAPEFYPQPGNPPQGWGLTFFLTIEEGETGRGRNTGWWAGISNQFWWCDREKGVAGMICGQVLPFGGKLSFFVSSWVAEID
jgi:CubicO group peptidase (beta-lactamase class C family)